MEKMHMERHEAEYRIDGLTLTEGGCLFQRSETAGAAVRILSNGQTAR